MALKITHFWSFSIALVHCYALSLIYEYRTRFDASPASLSVDTGRILSLEESKLFKEERNDKYGHVRVYKYLPYILRYKCVHF